MSALSLVRERPALVVAVAERVEPVDDGLELGGKSKVIDRRGKDDHVRHIEFGIELLHVVLLDAGQAVLFPAALARLAARDLHAADPQDLGLMPLFPRRGGERLREDLAVALWARTPHQYQDVLFHATFLRPVKMR